MLVISNSVAESNNKVNPNRKMSSITFSSVCEKHVRACASEYAAEILSAASEKYGFDLEEAKSTFMATPAAVVRSKKQASPKVPKVKVEKEPKFVLPFCGEVSVCPSLCQGIRLNHQLFTQCTNDQESGSEFCSTCQKQAAKSSSGKPTYGTVADRLATGLLDYSANGKKVVRYSKVMDKLNIKREAADAAAEAAGIVIPVDQFEVVVAKKGRPPKAKDPTVSDTDSEKSTVKKVGRPKKNDKVLKSSTSDDLIADLVARASKQTDSDSSEVEMALKSGEIEASKATTDEVKAPSKTAITKASKSELSQMCSAVGLKEEKKTQMQKNLRAHYGYDSDSDSEKGEKKPVAEKTKAVEETTAELVHELHEADSEDDEEEDEDEEIDVKPVEIKGKTYFKDDENNLYDPVTNVPVGKLIDGEVVEEDEEDEDED